MTQWEIDRLAQLWTGWSDSRRAGRTFPDQPEFNELVSKCCTNGHKYPDGSDAVTVQNMHCCTICGWDKYV